LTYVDGVVVVVVGSRMADHVHVAVAVNDHVNAQKCRRLLVARRE
jgi:hypothetical protein